MARRRTSSSVRFDPYWKLQWWDPTSITWRDVQRAHATEEGARRTAGKQADIDGRTYRLMHVTPEGRSPVEL